MRQTAWIDLARAVSLGTAREVEILRERAGDARVARAVGPDGVSVVVKLWNRPGWRGLVRRWTRTSPAWREWRTLSRLHRAGLFVPRPLAHVAGLGHAAHTEGVVSQDLGHCSDAVEYFKGLIRSGVSDQEAAFVREVVRATAVMVRLGLLDTDHRLPNFVVTPDGRPVRLDFELNVRSPWPRLWTRKYGLMLGTLLGSFVFAVQPDQERVVAFATDLRRELDPPRRVLLVAEARIREMLARQKREIGLDMEVDNPWKL